MTLKVIGAGLGRTGTNSLRLALNQLGFGPCHHMFEVRQDLPRNLPLWVANAKGAYDWPESYAGFNSAVDWPTASFYPELAAAYPDAKFILTTRNPESWAQSFAETIGTIQNARDKLLPEQQLFVDMSISVTGLVGINGGLDQDGLIAAFNAHSARVKATIPTNRLLEYQVSQGWEPLCAFLEVPVPPEPFPRSNDREEFHDRDREFKKG